MEDRHRIEGNTAPSSDPEPGIPAADESTRNTLSPSTGWPNVGNDGRFAVPGNPAPGSDPGSG